jgi:pimeloyl-ACP methyl ester carboxylesterase
MKVFRSIAILLSILLLASCLLPYAIRVSETVEVPIATPYRDSRFMEVEGVSFHYRVTFPKNSKPLGYILLVHGLGGSTFTFDGMVPSLVEAGYVVVAVDLPAFGYSDRTLDFDHGQANRAKYLWELLDNLEGFTKNEAWHLVGHSMGGGTVAAMAVAQPGRTASLTLIAGALENNGGLLMSLLHFPPYARWTQIFIERSLLKEERIVKILHEAYGRSPSSLEVKAYLDPLLIPGTARALTGFAKSSKAVPLSLLDELDMPVLAIWGDRDTVVPLEASRVIGVHLPQMRLHVIEGAAHIPMETHTAECSSILLEFLADLSK